MTYHVARVGSGIHQCNSEQQKKGSSNTLFVFYVVCDQAAVVGLLKAHVKLDAMGYC